VVGSWPEGKEKYPAGKGFFPDPAQAKGNWLKRVSGFLFIPGIFR
jgi:hypothetical protein